MGLTKLGEENGKLSGLTNKEKNRDHLMTHYAIT